MTPAEMTDVDDHEDFGGLGRDAARLLSRRRALRLTGGVGLLGLVSACGGRSEGAAQSSASTTAATTGPSSVAPSAGAAVATAGGEIPDETQGPYPADGSNGPNVLTDGAVLRSDLTTSFGDATGTAPGVPLTLHLTLVDARTAAPRAGAALYLWHCTADGQYSIYEVEDQNYLRGVQTSDDAGRITFTTVFPGCYAGRWPHAHFEVYESLASADAGSDAIKTSQIALPQSACETVYADGRYGRSSSNLGRLSLASDGIFADGWSQQLATVDGSVDAGMTASLLIRL